MTAGDDLDGADVRPHDSRVVRALLIAAGTLCVELGVIG